MRPPSGRLHQQTGAIAVDMESHVVADAAARHGVPVAAIRVVIDPAERTIPRSALAGTRRRRHGRRARHRALAAALSARPRRADPDVARCARGARHAGARQRAARPGARPARCAGRRTACSRSKASRRRSTRSAGNHTRSSARCRERRRARNGQSSASRWRPQRPPSPRSARSTRATKMSAIPPPSCDAARAASRRAWPFRPPCAPSRH